MEGLEGEKPEGWAGYYYTWENAQGACPTGYSLPTREQYISLRNLFNVNKLAFGVWLFAGTQKTAFAGNGGAPGLGQWVAWGTHVRTWSADPTMYARTAQSEMSVVEMISDGMLCVRCVKN
jgi:uncharacterized protein (TIGR02145 family)